MKKICLLLSFALLCNTNAVLGMNNKQKPTVKESLFGDEDKPKTNTQSSNSPDANASRTQLTPFMLKIGDLIYPFNFCISKNEILKISALDETEAIDDYQIQSLSTNISTFYMKLPEIIDFRLLEKAAFLYWKNPNFPSKENLNLSPEKITDIISRKETFRSFIQIGNDSRSIDISKPMNSAPILLESTIDLIKNPEYAAVVLNTVRELTAPSYNTKDKIRIINLNVFLNNIKNSLTKKIVQEEQPKNKDEKIKQKKDQTAK